MKLAVLLLALSLLSVGTANAQTILFPDDLRIVKQGKALYDLHCAACHGANLEGQPNWKQRRADGKLPAPPQDESGHTWHHPELQLFDITKYGPQKFAGPNYKTDMPAFDGILTDDEIIAVLSYIKSTWSDEIRAHNTAMCGG